LLEQDAPDALSEDAPALAACFEGAILQRVAFGPQRGRPVMKLGQPLATHLASAASRVERGGPPCARVDGFDLHGQLAFGAGERTRIERLVRYCARPRSPTTDSRSSPTAATCSPSRPAGATAPRTCASTPSR
jgi:hypothetical protein